jgi:hypothetical protein
MTVTHNSAELHGGQSDAAGGAEHDQRLTGLKASTVFQRVMRGAVGVEERRRIDEVDPFRNRNHRPGADRDLLGQPAPSGRCEDPITDRDAVHARARRAHDPGDLGAGREGERRLELVQVLNDEDVGEVDRARPDVHDHLSFGGSWLVDLLEPQRLGRAELAAEDSSHGSAR